MQTVFIRPLTTILEDVGEWRTARIVVNGAFFLPALQHEILKTMSSAF